MARRRSSASRKSISKAREHLETVASEARDEDPEKRDKEDVSSDFQRRTSDIQESVSTPESGVVASEGEEGLTQGEAVENEVNISNQPDFFAGESGVENTSNEMARAYGKYSEEVKDTPKHLYGFDGKEISSDEDESDVDIQSTMTENSKTQVHKKLGQLIKNYWKHFFQGISILIISGILLAVLLQAFLAPRVPIGEDSHTDTLKKIEEKVDKLSSALQAIAKLSESSPDSNKTLISEESVQQIVQDALNRYNADKVGMADFALESSGAEIHDSYHSPSYDVGSARIVLFGIPLWFDIKPPRVILQSSTSFVVLSPTMFPNKPDNTPGNCWAFKGDKGYVVIKLSRALTPTSFSMEHIPKLLSPTGDGRIPSAPKEFTVWGWKDALGSERVKLGYYMYDSDSDFLQTFGVQLMDNGSEVFEYIELRILSNHGNPEYTCIYRFRVHGNPQ